MADRVKIKAQPDDLRNKSKEELETLLQKYRTEVAFLSNPINMYGSMETAKKNKQGVSNLGPRRKEMRRNIARILTILHERELGKVVGKTN